MNWLTYICGLTFSFEYIQLFCLIVAAVDASKMTGAYLTIIRNVRFNRSLCSG